MGIEGQFAGTQRQPAFIREGRGKGYLYDIRRFAMLEKDREYGRRPNSTDTMLELRVMSQRASQKPSRQAS